MNKAVSALALVALIASGILPVTAQRGPLSGNTKRQVPTHYSKEAQETTRFGSVEAFSDGNKTLVKWTMAVERSSIGFNILRTDASGTKVISPEMVPGSALIYGDEPVFAERYSFVDHDDGVGAIYSIENVSTDGRSLFSSGVPAMPASELDSIERGDSERKIDPKNQPKPALDSILSLPKDVETYVKENAAVADPGTHQWVIAQPGVVIGVNKNGLHRVTRAELEAGGFNVNTDHNNWQLYDRGVQQAIIVDPAGQYIEFIGQAVDTNESDTRAYFLINGPAAGKRMRLRTARPNTGTVVSKNYQQSFSLKERTIYTNSIRNGDLGNFWGRIINSTATTLTFDLSGIDMNSPTAYVNLRFQGFSSGLHNVLIKLNGVSLPTAVSAGQLAFQVTYPVPTSQLVEGQNSLEFQAANSGDTSLFDQVNISFDRKHLMPTQGATYFYSLNDRKIFLDGLDTANTRLFDIGIDGDPREVVNLSVTPGENGFRMAIPAARGTLLYAVEEGEYATHRSIVPIGSRILSDPATSADLVIITHPNFLTEAQQWAQYRQGQGTSVDVVLVGDIFEEFNYGVLSADAIKSFLNYAKNNWAGPPQYVLLIGDATYDPRNFNGGAAANYVPARIVNTIFSETASDDFLTDFNNDGLSEIAIGRIPARTGALVTMALGKVSRWESNLDNPLSRGALFAFDNPDGYDFEAMSVRLKNRLPKGTPSTMVGRFMPDAKATLVAAINEGHYIANYSGHGSTGAWAGTSFFWNANVTCTSGETHCVNNFNEETMFTMLTCLNGFFHNLTANSLAESLLFAENKGAVASWASTGLTTPDVQEVMGQRFYTKIGTGEIQRLGDLINDAKTQIPGGTDVRLSWALLGDPMLKMN